MKFSIEQEDWLRNNFYQVGGYEELTDKFNVTFGTARTVSQISDKCNKGLKLIGMTNRSKYGQKRKEELPIGTIRSSINGVNYIKVAMIDGTMSKRNTGYKEPYWKPIQKKIWEDAYGECPDGHMICFLDGDRTNLELDNLYCINRKISAIMSRNKWWAKDKELTLTAIKWCELFYAIKDMSE